MVLTPESTPTGFLGTTLVVNLVGAGLLGWLVARLPGPADGHRIRRLRLLVGTGLLGGFTTYSALALSSVQLLQQGKVLTAVGFGGGTLVLGAAASWLGLHLGSCGSGLVIMVALAAIAGGVGAVARFGLDTFLARRLPDGWLRILMINISGSLLLGLLAGLTARPLLEAETRLVVGTGFLGGYTTFSAASLATIELVEQRRWGRALLSSVGMLLASIGAAALGLAVGGKF